ncbi:MAG: ECF transporter S component [Clostridiales bacterium]|jgi:uncharacterized membrane protein|nr:ECF transporter S component [Clostridiales bacterium]
MNTNKKTLFLVQFGILLAVEAIFCFTPLGSLPAVGPIVATLGMIPVIITALLLGTKAGAIMGAFAGLFSLLVWTFTPPSPLVAFVFTPFYTFGEFRGNFGSLLICFVPRILVGLVAGLMYTLLSKKLRRADPPPGRDRVPDTGRTLAYSLSAALGSLANTFGVMGGIWLFFRDQYASVAGSAILLIIGSTILFSGIPEAIVSAIAAAAVCKPLKSILSKNA